LRRKAVLDAKEIAVLRQANADLIQAFEELRAEYEKSNALLRQQSPRDAPVDGYEQDKSEVDFYLNEMAEVKERIVQNLKAAKSQMLAIQASARDSSFQISFNIDQEEVMQSVKDMVRGELDHLLILNSYSLEIQNITLELAKSNPHEKFRIVIERVMKLLDNGVQIQDPNDVDEVLDHLTAQWELTHDENKLLLKEREYYYD